MTSIDRYAVFGNPVAHSQSPAIHKLFAEQTNQNLIYTAELIEREDFANSVANFSKNNGKGINITVPFKQEAWTLATKKSKRAERAGAVNTLVIQGEKDYFGDNTDGMGLVKDLIRNYHLNLTGKNILVIGAGGAVRGILEPLLENNPSSIVITNRTEKKAIKLADGFSDLGPVSGCGLTDVEKNKYDIVINGTSASLSGETLKLPAYVISENTFCYDMMYAKEPTLFMEWAMDKGANNAVDGLGMLVEQAAESFSIWRGVHPDTQAVIHSLRH